MARANRYFLPGYVWHITGGNIVQKIQTVQPLHYVQDIAKAVSGQA